MKNERAGERRDIIIGDKENEWSLVAQRKRNVPM